MTMMAARWLGVAVMVCASAVGVAQKTTLLL